MKKANTIISEESTTKNGETNTLQLECTEANSHVGHFHIVGVVNRGADAGGMELLLDTGATHHMIRNQESAAWSKYAEVRGSVVQAN